MILLWLIYCLVISGSLFALSFTTVRGLSDLWFALLLLPLLPTLLGDTKLALNRTLRRRKARLLSTPTQVFHSDLPTLTADPLTPTVIDPLVSDNNRRIFLKLIGSSGAMLFFMAIFSKQAHAAFFGSMPGPGTLALKNSDGDVINPAEAQPTDGYEISEIDDSGTDSYYGFVHQNGAWYITKESSTGAYRYAKGISSFSTSWALRTTLAYDYFDTVF